MSAVRRFVVAAGTIAHTDATLQEAGADGYERFVLWTGVQLGDDFAVRTLHVPEQTAFRTEEGLCVRVDGAALHRFNVWQYEHGETLGVQIHSHPKEAYHSDTDDAFPIVTAVGGISLVVPDFARAGVGGAGVVAYRLTDDGWEELDDDETHALLLLER